MGIDLTEEQRLAVINGEAVRVSAPQIGSDIVLLRADAFAELQELLKDEQQHRAFRQAGLKSALRWLKDNPY